MPLSEALDILSGENGEYRIVVDCKGKNAKAISQILALAAFNAEEEGVIDSSLYTHAEGDTVVIDVDGDEKAGKIVRGLRRELRFIKKCFVEGFEDQPPEYWKWTLEHPHEDDWGGKLYTRDNGNPVEISDLDDAMNALKEEDKKNLRFSIDLSQLKFADDSYNNYAEDSREIRNSFKSAINSFFSKNSTQIDLSALRFSLNVSRDLKSFYFSVNWNERVPGRAMCLYATKIPFESDVESGSIVKVSLNKDAIIKALEEFLADQ